MLIKRVWLDTLDGEQLDPENGNVDVMVEMVNGEMWTAHFVTLPYLKQQLELSRDVAGANDVLGSVGFVAMETPHVVAERLTQEAIEDVIDDLMMWGTFESVFDLVIDTPDEPVLS